jgi:hypothetical protein
MASSQARRVGGDSPDGLEISLALVRERVGRIENTLRELESLPGRDYAQTLRDLLAELRACRAGARQAGAAGASAGGAPQACS